jgi:hypothetical protein
VSESDFQLNRFEIHGSPGQGSISASAATNTTEESGDKSPHSKLRHHPQGFLCLTNKKSGGTVLLRTWFVPQRIL